MSDDWTIIVPADPFYRATANTCVQIEAWLKSIGTSDETEHQISTKPVFVDAGSNFDSVSCPICGGKLEMGVWSDWMSTDFDGEGFRLQSRTMTCCGAKDVTLNDLKYEFPQAFASTQIEALNLNVGWLTAEQVLAAEQIMGTKLRVIYQHI